MTLARLLTASEAADLLRLRESTLRDLARRGLVPSVKIGRALRFVESDLAEFVESQKEGLGGS